MRDFPLTLQTLPPSSSPSLHSLFTKSKRNESDAASRPAAARLGQTERSAPRRRGRTPLTWKC